MSPHTMSVVVKALIRSRILYAAEVWYHYLAQQLQIEYNRALRLIHGLPRFTPVDSMLLEVGQLPLEAQVSINMVKAYERWSRGYPDLQRKLRTTPPLLTEVNKGSYRLTLTAAWKEKTKEVYRSTPLAITHTRRPAAIQFCIAPWVTYGMENVDINVFLTHKKKEELLEEEQRQLVEDKLLRPAEWEIWTDGSMNRALLASGAGAVILKQGQVIQEISEPVGHIANYTAEVKALKLSIVGLLELMPQQHNKVIVLTDSQSALAALAKGPLRQTDIAMCEIWKLLLDLAKRVKHVTFQHVFSHCGLKYNDQADELANGGTHKDQATGPTHVRDVIGTVI